MINFDELNTCLQDSITNAEQVVIATHIKPDFDTIGSALALSAYCKKLNKKPCIIVDTDVPACTKLILDQTQNRYLYAKAEDLKEIVNEQLLIVVDGNKPIRLSLGKSIEYFKNIVVIDHHRIESDTIKTNKIFIDENSSSTCEIIYFLLKKAKIKPESYTAAYLLSGILLDTDHLKRRTSPDTLLACSELKRAMLKKLPDEFVDNLFKNDYESDRKVQGLVGSTDFIRMTYAIAMNHENPNEIYDSVILAQAADYLLRYDVSAIFSLGYTKNDTVSISARSKGDDNSVDIVSIMNLLGGGGSKVSAAAQLVGIPIEEVKNRLEKILRLERKLI